MAERGTANASPSLSATAWPNGGGEMAGRIRAYDWAATPLGPIEAWPQALRTAVEMVLASPLVSSLVCGPERVLIYNDAAARLYGARHPTALGCPLPETFPEGWRAVAPLYERVFAGESVQVTAQPLDTRGEGETVSDVFDAVLIPLRDEQGRVTFAHMTGFEIGDRLRADAALREREERQAFLLKLSDALRPLADAAEIQATTTRLLGQHLGVDRSMYGEVEGEPGAETGIIRGQYVRPTRGDEPPVLPFPERFTFQPFGAHTMAARYRGEVLVVADVNADPGFEPSERAAWKAAGVRAAVVAPLAKGGRLVAEFGVHCTAPRAWTDAEVSLVQEVAERTWAAAERARAEERLRKSEAKYRNLFDTMGQGYCELELLRDAQGRAIDQRYLELNPAFERLFGIPVAEAKGRTANKVFPQLDAQWTEAFDRIAKSGASERIEYQFISLGRWFEVFAYPLGGDRLTVLYEDVTERKQAEIALRESEERQTFLLALGDAMRAEANASRKIEVAACHLGERLNASRVLYAEYDWTRNVADIFNGWFADGAKPFPTVMRLEDYEGEVLNDLRAGRTVRVDNVGLLVEEPAYAAIAAVGVQGLLSVPLIVNGRLAVNVSIHQHEPRQWTDDEVALVQEVAERLWADVVRARAEAALRESEARLQGALSINTVGVMFWGEGFRLTQVNDAFLGMTGFSREELLGKSWQELTPEGFHSVSLQAVEQVTTLGEATPYEKQYCRKDGSRWWGLFTARKVGDEVVEFVLDVTDRRKAEAALRHSEERLQVLVAELQHRTRNLLGVVRSIADRTLASSGSLDEFQERFSDRLGALSRVNGLLSRLEESARISFDELLQAELAGHGVLDSDGHEAQVTLAGPKGIRLRSSMAQTFALGLHELATNALKHGALSRPAGRLLVRWGLVDGQNGDRRLRVEWQESGVPVPPPARGQPYRRGSGRELIERALPYQLGAETSYELTPEGVRCTITLPISTTHREAEHA